MLTKTQKIWLWVFLAMFMIPEMLFSFVISVIELFGLDFNPLYTLFINQQFFIDSPIYLFIFNIIELIGVLGMLIISIKLNRKIISVILGIVLVWLIFVIFLGYI